MDSTFIEGYLVSKILPILLANLFQSSRSTLFLGKFTQLFCLQRRYVGYTNFGTGGLANSIPPISNTSVCFSSVSGSGNNSYRNWPRWALRLQKSWVEILLLALSEKEVVYLAPAYGGRRSTIVQLQSQGYYQSSPPYQTRIWCQPRRQGLQGL